MQGHYPDWERFGLKGRDKRVDTGFRKGPAIADRNRAPYELFGQGLRVALQKGDEFGVAVYRDSVGTRLLVGFGPHFACDTLVLTQVSKSPGQHVERDLAGLETDRGIRLGMTPGKVVSLLGRPSTRSLFRGSSILWYRSKPRTIKLIGSSYPEGHIAGYLFQRDRLVEILMSAWSLERHG